jgi:hypothetical protein
VRSALDSIATKRPRRATFDRKGSSPKRCYLLGPKNCQHPLTLLLRLLFEFSVFRKSLDDVFHHLSTFVDVSHFATMEDYHDLDFVLVLQETDSLADFGINIVLTSFRAKSNFLGLGLMALPACLLASLIFVLAEIHDSANGWFFVWSDLDKIETGITSAIERFIGSDNPQLFSVLSNDSYRRNANLRINASLNPIDC